jgi:extradiol dioxygenase family protein
VDFDFGHQLVIHQAPKMAYQAANSNPVDGHDVPVPHFSAGWDDWHSWRRDSRPKAPLVIEPLFALLDSPANRPRFFSTRAETH